MKHAIDSPFPEAKISETFLKFAEPILGNESGSLTAEETEKALSVAFVVWNAVVYDTLYTATQNGLRGCASRSNPSRCSASRQDSV